MTSVNLTELEYPHKGAVGRCDDERRGAKAQGDPTEAPLGSGCWADEDSDIPPARGSLYRSRSLPHLVPYRDCGVGCCDSYSGVEHDQDIDANSIRISNCQKVVYDLRQLLTLKQHYYPEGGWGWIVVLCAFLVQCLSHGFHGASGIILQEVIRRFEHVEEYKAGTSNDWSFWEKANLNNSG
ncbi:hypothetical protein RUM44_012994 [Polyplax serrata]|uniref:Uncharacterized protein n=1 Tax=Polyplax serrata TaxID=468196 RepID=A0ABR1BH90_POLSC